MEGWVLLAIVGFCYAVSVVSQPGEQSRSRGVEKLRSPKSQERVITMRGERPLSCRDRARAARALGNEELPKAA